MGEEIKKGLYIKKDRSIDRKKKGREGKLYIPNYESLQQPSPSHSSGSESKPAP